MRYVERCPGGRSHGLDGGATAQLAFDNAKHAAFLAADDRTMEKPQPEGTGVKSVAVAAAPIITYTARVLP